jgi:alkyl hydroperoxide reductase subunit AhpF
MPLLDDRTRRDVKALLDDMVGQAHLVVFTQEFECQFCRETRQICEEIADLTDRISVTVYDFQKDSAEVERYGIDKIPAIAILGEDDRDYGVRYYGIPSGYEFSSLLHDIKAVAAGPERTALSGETVGYLNSLEEELHLQVFVTPT